MAVNNDIPKPPGCSTPLKGCLIVVGLIMSLLLAAMIYLAKSPSMQAIFACKSNMAEISAAISRYEDVNGHRPPNLRALATNYLKDASVLRCPLDKSSGDKPSYTYNPSATGSQIMLECDRHRWAGELSVRKLQTQGDGTFTMTSPSFRETLKQAQKRASQ